MYHWNGNFRNHLQFHIIKGLVNGGAQIRIYCPEGTQKSKWRLHNEQDSLTYCQDLYEAVHGSDAVVIITGWSEFKSMDMERVKALMKDRYFFDLRNLLRQNPPKGFIYTGLVIPHMEV